MNNNKGLALILFVMLIGVLAILFMATSWSYANAMRKVQLDIDQTKAHYLAQAGVMRSIWNWYTNSTTNEISRRWDQINTTITGNQIFKTGMDSAGADLQSNFAYVVPGIAYVKNVVTATNNVGTTSIIIVTIPAGTTVPVGNLLVVYFAMEGGGGAWVGGVGPSGCIDSVGNSYTRAVEVVGPTNDANGVRTVIWYSLITTALANPNTITIDWTTNRTAEAVSISEFSGVTTLDQVQSNFANGTAATSNNTPNTNFANQLLVGAIGVEGPVGDVFAAGASYLAAPPTEAGVGTGAAGSTIDPEYRIVSATDAYAANGTTGATARDWAAAIATFYNASNWFTSGLNRRLRYWQIYNINNGGAVTLDKIKVSWTPAGAELLNDFVLNGVSKWPGGTAASGTTVDVTDTALANGASWNGPNTYFQWNASPPDPVTVTCQFIFSGDTSTTDARTNEVVMWNGAQANGAGMPLGRTFTTTATGQVNQSGDTYFKVLKTVKATVSGAPGRAALEITDWDEGDKSIP